MESTDNSCPEVEICTVRPARHNKTTHEMLFLNKMLLLLWQQHASKQNYIYSVVITDAFLT